MIAFLFYRLALWARGAWRYVGDRLAVIVPALFITAILLRSVCTS